MSRELKFRAWDTKVKQPMWDHEGCLSLLLLQGRVLNGTAAEEGREHLERFKIMQYTGLKDNNGKEIYEGDILRAIKNCLTKEGETVKVVNFERGCFMSGDVDLIISVEGFHPEIIGNIYENPELLGEK